ncbi:MAG: hypothetical protein FJX31_00280 [Alphaproteobacteria bacterium]|nr:hypothetical protein [Alphaproteobacteria bacterium]
MRKTRSVSSGSMAGRSPADPEAGSDGREKGRNTGYPKIDRRSYGLNYGLNKVRFLALVKCGKRVRGHFTLIDMVERQPNRYQLTSEVSVEIEGEDTPALVAEWLTFVEVEPQQFQQAGQDHA